MTQKTSLGVVVPCYNEERNVTHFESEMSQFLAMASVYHPHLDIKFYVVDNNSTDGTGESLTQLAAKYRAVQLLKCNTQGYGAALKYGFDAAKSNQYISFLDFDNTYPMAALFKLLAELEEKKLDLIYGARLHAESEIDPIRRFGNRLYVVLLKLLMRSNLSDVCSGMRVFRSELAHSIIKLEKNDLAFSIQLTGYALLNKWKVGELPISYRKRVGHSKLSVIRDGTVFLLVAIRTGLLKKV